MFPRVINANYIKNYEIEFLFDDEKSGIIDLKNELYGEMFEQLNDIKSFRAFSINHDIHTIVWENGADLAPEFLYEKAITEQKN
jgi:hypothetical protein